MATGDGRLTASVGGMEQLVELALATLELMAGDLIVGVQVQYAAQRFASMACLRVSWMVGRSRTRQAFLPTWS